MAKIGISNSAEDDYSLEHFFSDRLLAPPQTSPETDREALIALYNATHGADRRKNTNWLSDSPVSEWHGVAIDTDNGRVVKGGAKVDHVGGSTA